MFKALMQAQAANDFHVTVSDVDWKQEWIDMISAQTTSVKVNLVWRRVEITVRQLRSGWIQDLIFHIMKSEFKTIDQIRVRPAKRQAYEYVFSKGLLIDHEAVFTYYSRDDLTHRLVFEFDEVALHSKESHAITAQVNISD